MLGLAGEKRLLPRLLLYVKTSSATADSGPWLKRVPHHICPGADRKIEGRISTFAVSWQFLSEKVERFVRP